MSGWRDEHLAEGVRLICADCREVLPTLGKVDAVVTDPPYGINWSPRTKRGQQRWVDDVVIDVKQILVGRYNLVWGAQYFADQLPVKEGWLVWCKRPPVGFADDDARTYATTEMAWRDWGKAGFMVHVWDGGKRAGAPENRTFCHPSQKPIEVMDWCIRKLPDDALTVLDPFMGSGTTGVSAVRAGKHFVGIEEIDHYFDIACRRISDALSRPDLFVQAPAPKPVQETLL